MADERQRGRGGKAANVVTMGGHWISQTEVANVTYVVRVTRVTKADVCDEIGN
ncbi:MAG: hypothetical protein H7201_08330 [Candidatus Saccharibacteria bacterium]|nr:hypothetical protein [Microbacteriaceae bacterium]